MLILIFDNSENWFSFLLKHYVDNEDLSITRMLKIAFFFQRQVTAEYVYLHKRLRNLQCKYSSIGWFVGGGFCACFWKKLIKAWLKINWLIFLKSRKGTRKNNLCYQKTYHTSFFKVIILFKEQVKQYSL